MNKTIEKPDKNDKRKLILAVCLGFAAGCLTIFMLRGSLRKFDPKFCQEEIAAVERDLKAPVFVDPQKPLLSNAYGEAHVRWKPVYGAQQYLVRVFDEDNKEIQSYKTNRTFTYVKKLALRHGEKERLFKVTVTAIGADAREGPPSLLRELKLLSMRNLNVPLIKSIEVEE
jgi:hypothetical protein